MYSKENIFNLALGALLLQRQIADWDTDTSNENRVLNTNWDVALRSTLEDLNLDSTATEEALELVAEDPVDGWAYAYLYPTNCALFRRIKSPVPIDDRESHIPKKIAIYDGDKVIFTNEQEAIGEFIPHDISLLQLSANAGLAIAYKLALLCAPALTGKGAKALMKDIQEKYLITKAEAQEQDKNENFNYVDESIESEFVKARLS